MSLKKKITYGFLISASIIALLIVFEYINFVQMRNEIIFLELTDTLRTNSLQIRRHEKNFFLYGPQKSAEESAEVHRYLKEILGTLTVNKRTYAGGEFLRLQSLTAEYGDHFDRIEASLDSLDKEMRRKRGTADSKYEKSLPLIEMTFMERPLESSEYLTKNAGLPPDDRLVSGLKAVDGDIKGLRKTGEDVIGSIKELDRAARDRIEHTIKLSQLALLIVFPLFLLIGLGSIFLILSSVTLRLAMLTNVVEHTGKGVYPRVPQFTADTTHKDEVDVLVEKFNNMEKELAQRERELAKKTEELMQTKKLAAIGTLASGVAHELNNPLNNIYLSAQVLEELVSDDSPPKIKEVIGDIVGQTERVKGIIGDLLDFARGQEPKLAPTDIVPLIREAYGLANNASAYGGKGIKFLLEAPPACVIPVDPGQMERVFINIFANAIDAMSGAGELAVTMQDAADTVRITVSDTGPGISQQHMDKIFEPFFTTKEKGTGLGLAIVFNIVKKHGGEIKAGNKNGGAVLEITLPKKTREIKADAV
jgi:two-component system, NtrC family, sensor kinase